MDALQLSACGTFEDVFQQSKNNSHGSTTTGDGLARVNYNLLSHCTFSVKDMFSLRPIRNANSDQTITLSGNKESTFPGTEIFSISQRAEAIAHSLKGGKVLFDLRSM